MANLDVYGIDENTGQFRRSATLDRLFKSGGNPAAGFNFHVVINPAGLINSQSFAAIPGPNGISIGAPSTGSYEVLLYAVLNGIDNGGIAYNVQIREVVSDTILVVTRSTTTTGDDGRFIMAPFTLTAGGSYVFVLEARVTLGGQTMQFGAASPPVPTYFGVLSP